MAVTKELKDAGTDVGRSLLGQFADWVKGIPGRIKARRAARKAKR